ncbi:MAG TPA: iron-containing alcohol dehydrogenase [Gammaproteobacteria bacterium]|nr:iron-containing alcohol dehydrogenase [Gammaproteobacteria bacterium]
MNANWNYPTAMRVGPGRLSELPNVCQEAGISAPLLVTDPGLATLPMVENAIIGCREAGLRCELFSNIKPNPTGQNVEDGVQAYVEGQHDGVIAFGGGSGIDAAKAVALMAHQSVSIWELEDVGDNWTRANGELIAPIVALPTTAGTGAEVGRASVILDESSETKKIIFHPKMLPQIVILDPELTVGLPAALTAATGMDAFSHSLEAWSSPLFHPMAEGIAAEGIRLVREYLPRAVRDGADIEARTQMLVASSMGATSFQRGLGAIHALAHPLGALYDAHHGTLNAVLMPYVLKANRSAIESRIERLGRYIGLSDTGFDSFMDWVLSLRAEINIPSTLSELGIDDQQSHRIGQMAVQDPSAGTNPITYSAEDYERLFLSALTGQL